MSKRALSPGTVIRNQYRVEKVLGEGGFGVTYKVWDSKENRTAALKEYFPMEIATRASGSQQVIPTPGSESAYERFRQDFINEAQTIYNFQNHPNIVSVTKLFQFNNTAYYVMGYIEGSDLSHSLGKHPGHRMSWEELQPIIAQTVTALKAVHTKGVIHCDISPDNIFVMRGGQIKLIDFGAAKRAMNTQSSVVLLKRGYAPLEQMSANGKIGPWTDIYALAVTIYLCLTGELPPSAENRVMNDTTVWPTQKGFREPFPGWEKALMRGMAIHYEHRYHSVEEFWHDISGGHLVPKAPITLTQPVVLEGTRGYYAGRRLAIRDEVMMGVDAGKCSVSYPIGTPGVSRVHLRLWPQNGKLMLMDMGSTYGTWINNNKMVRGLVYVLEEGTTVFFGDDQEFRAVQDNTTQQTAYTAPYQYTAN